MEEPKSSAPSFPEPAPVGSHLVIDRSEWVPGEHPESHRRTRGNREYLERYYVCLLCGAERIRKDEFPEECPGMGPTTGE